MKDFIFQKKLGTGYYFKGDAYVKYSFFDFESPLVITFAGAGQCLSEDAAQNGASPWGFDFLFRKKINVVSFAHIVSSNWYLSEEIQYFVKELSELANEFSCVLGYGGSMGGYGVSAYANMLKMDRVLLINPISSLNRRLVPYESRFSYAQKFNWSTANDGAECRAKGYIIYDPFCKEDSIHANRINKLNKITTPGLGHGVAMYLSSLNMLKSLFKEFYGNTLDPLEFKKDFRVRKRYLERYYEVMLSNKSIANSKLRTKVVSENKLAYVPYLSKSSGRLSNAEVNLLRDTALALEDEDVLLSYKLMSIAYKQRNGKIINDKLKEYKDKLVEKNFLIN